MRWAFRYDWLAAPAVLLLLFGTILAYDIVSLRQARPPEHVRTLKSFLEWRPGPHPALVRHIAGDKHLVVFAALHGFLASGPAAYVFDASGRLVDWAGDSGDDNTFQQKWSPAGRRIEIDTEFVRDWVEEQ